MAVCVCVCVCVCARARARARLAMSNAPRPHWTVAHQLLCPWDFPGKNTGVGCHFLLQGTFPARGSNMPLFCFQHWQLDPLLLVPPRKPMAMCIFYILFLMVFVPPRKS